MEQYRVPAGQEGDREGSKMTTSEDTGSRKSTYTLDEFVAKLQDFMASRVRGDRSVESNRGDDCALVVTDTGLDLCCTVDTENGLEVECTNVLDILKPE
jgi:hypothetical protein